MKIRKILFISILQKRTAELIPEHTREEGPNRNCYFYFHENAYLNKSRLAATGELFIQGGGEGVTKGGRKGIVEKVLELKKKANINSEK